VNTATGFVIKTQGSDTMYAQCLGTLTAVTSLTLKAAGEFVSDGSHWNLVNHGSGSLNSVPSACP